MSIGTACSADWRVPGSGTHRVWIQDGIAQHTACIFLLLRVKLVQAWSSSAVRPRLLCQGRWGVLPCCKSGCFQAEASSVVVMASVHINYLSYIEYGCITAFSYCIDGLLDSPSSPVRWWGWCTPQQDLPHLLRSPLVLNYSSSSHPVHWLLLKASRFCSLCLFLHRYTSHCFSVSNSSHIRDLSTGARASCKGVVQG